ncbi:hypothetical protein [uncultured Bacteroides sp.]|uniref:hypothetical protein n=1 Tax=uncultured Bacteroides sp. TaxID=162156 RepID=UPI0025FFED92|nr:hypothetical protein [uncultured Bacteroides sp.]
MYSSEDFEKLWFLYKSEGQSKNVSLESFCLQQGVSCCLFYKCFSSRKKTIVPVEVVGLPADQLPLEEVNQETSSKGRWFGFFHPYVVNLPV